ncbi:MAG: hypothetical protein K5931_09180, partial [Lachnospiraceae bacterium]|nr:hypothetical protein [Lachnospiraceae bacterium]
NELCFDSVDIDKDITVSSDDGSPVYYRKSLETSDGGQKKRVFIRFYKDANLNEEGFPEGNKRVITVVIKTKLNEKWCEKGGTEDWLRKHQNYVAVTANGSERSATAEVYTNPAKKLTKTFAQSWGENADGVNYPFFKYEVVLRGVKEDTVVIEESFNSLLKLAKTDKDNTWIIGVTNNNYTYAWEKRLGLESYEIDETGATTKARLTFKVPKNDDGSYHDTYKISYVLAPKSVDALNEMKVEAVKNNGYIITNTASWSGLTSTVTNKYTYNTSGAAVGKNEIEKPTKENGYTGKYMISVNKEGLKYGNQDYLDIYDIMTNLKLVNTADKPVIATYDDNSTEILSPVWDSDQGGWKFQIKNGHRADITYYAKVIGEDGQTVKYSNAVSFFGYTVSSVSNESQVERAGGSGATKTLIIDKKASDSGTPIGGAVFRLYKWKGNTSDKVTTNESDWEPVVDNKGNYVDRATNASGNASFYGDAARDGWFLSADQYFAVKEIIAAAGYILDDSIHPFIVQNNYAINDPGESLTIIPIDGDGKLSITNEKAPTTEFAVKKVASGTNEALVGATFKLTPVNEDSLTNEQTYTTGNDGIITFTELYPGEDYTLTEESTPEGYVLPSPNTWTVNVSDNFVVTAEGLDFNGGFGSGEDASGSNTYMAVIENSPSKGSLTITKNVLDSDRNTKNTSEEFYVTIKDSTGKYYDQNGADSTEPVAIKVPANGNITANELPIGSYTVTEVASDGSALANDFDYKISYTNANGETDAGSEGAKATIAVGSLSPAVSLTNTGKKHGSITITKKDYTNVEKTLEGAEFTLKKGGSNLALSGSNGSYTYDKAGTVESLVTNASGKISVADLPYGTYVITETKAPVGYLVSYNKELSFTIDDNGITANGNLEDYKEFVTIAKSGNELSYTYKDKQKTFDLKLTKNKIIGSENSAFEGVAFTLKDSIGNTYSPETEKTGSDGVIYFRNLPWGTYTYEEILPEGYQAGENSTGSFTVNAENYKDIEGQLTKEISVDNTFIQGSVTLTKRNDKNEALQGAEFELHKGSADGALVSAVLEEGAESGRYVYSEESGALTRFLSGADGKVTISKLPKGNYYFKETKAPEGYVASTATPGFNIENNNDNITDLVMTNDTFSAGVKFKKVDSVDKSELSGVVFDLYKADKEGNYSIYLQNLSSNAGYVEISEGLGTGNYYFKEKSTVEGYVLDKTELYFTVTKADQKKIVTLMKKGDTTLTEKDNNGYAIVGNDRAMGSVVLEKYAEYAGGASTRKPLEGITFNLVPVKNGNLRDQNEDNRVTLTAVTELVDGKALATFPEVEWGSWYLEELSDEKNNAYIIPSKTETFNIGIGKGASLNKSFTGENAFVNKIKTGTVLLNKLDEDTREAINGAEFKLYSGNYDSTKPEEPIGNVYTVENGQIRIDNLEYGDYHFKEINAGDGYTLNKDENGNTKYPVYNFTIDGESDESQIDVLLNVTNKKALGKVKIAKVDE